MKQVVQFNLLWKFLFTAYLANLNQNLFADVEYIYCKEVIYLETD